MAIPGRRTTLASVVLSWACTIAPGTADPSTPGAVPPPGFGTLRQDEVSLSLSSGDLRIMVTPLHPSVTHVTAPDTQRRLAGLAAAHAPNEDNDGAGLFLVSVFSERPDVRFVPEEIEFVSRGIRIRPSTISPVTPTWGERRVRQRQTEMAVYYFSGSIDLESSLVLEYGLEQTAEWSAILPRIQAERGRARARAGVERN